MYTAAAQIEAAGGRALPVVGGIRDEAQVVRAVAQVLTLSPPVSLEPRWLAPHVGYADGVTDFDRYAYQPGAEPPADLFVDHA